MQQSQSIHNSYGSGWQTCTCCGIRFRLLVHPRGLRSSVRLLAQQRAYQCANCGQMVCNACSRSGFHCLCRTNAWVARPVFMRKRRAAMQG